MMLEKDPCGFIKKQCDNELGRVQGPVPPEMLSSATLVTVPILTKLCLLVTATWFHIIKHVLCRCLGLDAIVFG